MKRSCQLGRVSFSFAILFLSVFAVAQDGKVLYRDDFEKNPDVSVVLEGANLPYTANEIGLSTERARSGEHSLVFDVVHSYSIAVYAAPRTNQTPTATWGRLGGPGSFLVDGLGIPLNEDQGYYLTLYLWVDKASRENAVKIAVRTESDSPYGPVYSNTYLDQIIAEPTNEWVKVETELNSALLEPLAASGTSLDNIRLHSVAVQSFSRGRGSNRHLRVFVDDVTIRQAPAGAVEAQKKAEAELNAKKAAELNFKRIPLSENTFLWGAYGGIYGLDPSWYTDIRKPGTDPRLTQIEFVNKYSDWLLLDARRHYLNVVIQGGGMVFPNSSDSSFDYLKVCLDKMAEFGMRLVPSTYVTQHYIPDATREDSLEAMTRVADICRDHPGILAYLLVDEPQPQDAEDFYWGKAEMERLDANHACMCFCNNLTAMREYAATLPILGLDTYWLRTIPSLDPGCWAYADTVDYARRLGGRRIWVLPQSAGWSVQRAVTGEEFRVATFSCLAEGATGFAPYAFIERPRWHTARNERKRLIDPFGNPYPAYEEMKRLGPNVRSVAPLLIGAERLPESAVGARIPSGPPSVRMKHMIVSNVGRERPLGQARMFQDAKREARYVVAYNNSTRYPARPVFRFAKVAPGDELLDLFSARKVPIEKGGFRLSLSPAEGRVLALAKPAVLDEVAAEVAQNRYEIERDLLDLEIRFAKRMGTDTAPAEKLAAEAANLAKEGKGLEAVQTVADATRELARLNRANAPLRMVEGAIAQSRVLLGEIHAAMNAGIGDQPKMYPRDDADVKALMDDMIAVSDNFYNLRSDWTHNGPAGLGERAQKLQTDVRALKRRAEALFGI